jgi:hypothetical protein
MTRLRCVMSHLDMWSAVGCWDSPHWEWGVGFSGLLCSLCSVFCAVIVPSCFKFQLFQHCSADLEAKQPDPGSIPSSTEHHLEHLCGVYGVCGVCGHRVVGAGCVCAAFVT